MKKSNLVVSALIVLLVLVFFVFVSQKSEAPTKDNLVNNNMQNTKQVNGVKITVLNDGSGEPAKEGDIVAMNYTGTLTDGTVFDSNVDPKFGHVDPFSFTIGSGDVIKGWDIGVVGMKKGEKRKLEIAPEYAYGEYGAGGVIPPNATINFEVELVEIINK